MTDLNKYVLGGDMTPELFLSTANGSRDFIAEREKTLRYRGLGQEETEAFAVIADRLPRELARHVGAWIESGRNGKDGTERPRIRKLDFRGRHYVEAWLYLQKSSTIVVSDQGDLRLDLSNFEYPGLPISEPEEYAVEEAARLFLWLLHSGDLRYAIAQCHECDLFYFRLKPRAFYKRDTFCSPCRHRASVRRRMQEVRKEKQDLVIALAIRAHQKWADLSPRTRAQYENENEYILGQIGKRHGVTGNWLTRHQRQIHAESAAHHSAPEDTIGGRQ